MNLFGRIQKLEEQSSPPASIGPCAGLAAFARAARDYHEARERGEPVSVTDLPKPPRAFMQLVQKLRARRQRQAAAGSV